LVDFTAPDPYGYHITITNAAARALPTVWELASAAGRQVIVAGVPGTYPPSPVNGVLVTSFLAPGPESDYTYPRDLKDELQAHVGEFPLSPSEAHRGGSVERFVDDMRACAVGRMAVFRYLLREKPWGLAVLVFASTDMLQHELWHLLDPAHPRHDPTLAPVARRAALSFFQELDTHLGELMALAGENTTVILMSDHGFGPFHSFLHLNNWLRSQGWLQLKPASVTALKALAFRLGFTPLNVLKLLSAMGLGRLRSQVKGGKKGSLLRQLFLSFEDVDWSRTQAFAVGNFGQIYVNVSGERSLGCVQPGAEYEALRDAIAERALALRDPATGDPVVLQVHRREDVFHGDQLHRLPDLIVHTDRRRYVSFGHADFGSRHLIEPSFGQSGHHTLTGILAMRGPGVRPGMSLDDAHIVDLAPTILRLLQLPIPPHMDGQFLADALASELLNVASGGSETTAKRIPPETAATTRAPSNYSDQEEEAVRERLRGMGYLA